MVKYRYLLQLMFLLFVFCMLLSCWDMYYLALQTTEYVPHKILNNNSKDCFVINDLSIYRSYLYKSNRSKSKKTSMFLDVAQNNDYDSPFSYDIYVNNKIKGKGKSKIKSGVTPSSQNIKNSLEGYYYFSHRQFDEDTIRVVISNIEKTDSLIDISFIVDEKDSIPMKSKTLSFENKTDETVYVGISAIRNKSDDLIFITDVAVPPQFKNSILIRPNLISPLLWNNYLEENFKTMYVVVFPHKKDLNIWKFNPNFNNPNSTDTYTISLNEFGSIIKLVYPKIIKEL